MYMKRLLAILIMFWSLLGIVYGQNEFEKNVYVSASGDSLNYRLLRPEIEQEGEILYRYAHGVDSVENTNPDCDVLLTEAGYASLTKLTWNLQLNADAPDVSDLKL